MRVIAWNRSPKKHPKVEFVDLDDVIVARAAKTIREIFAEHGEAYFRQACASGWEGVIAKRADAP